MWGDEPVVLGRTCRVQAHVGPRVRERLLPLRLYLTLRLLPGSTVSRGAVLRPVRRPGPGNLALGRPNVAGLLPPGNLRVASDEAERGDRPNPCRPRRERVYGLTLRDKVASLPDETTCEGAARARK